MKVSQKPLIDEIGAISGEKKSSRVFFIPFREKQGNILLLYYLYYYLPRSVSTTLQKGNGEDIYFPAHLQAMDAAYDRR